MKMWWIVIIKILVNYDTIKTTNLGHNAKICWVLLKKRKKNYFIYLLGIGLWHHHPVAHFVILGAFESLWLFGCRLVGSLAY